MTQTLLPDPVVLHGGALEYRALWEHWLRTAPRISKIECHPFFEFSIFEQKSNRLEPGFRDVSLASCGLAAGLAIGGSVSGFV